MAAINGVGRAGTTSRADGRAPASAGGFSMPTAAQAAHPSASSIGTSELALAGLLALQAEQPGTVTDREARRRGHDMLAALAALQRALLAGTADAASLDQLAGLAGSAPPVSDPALSAVVGEITLRVRVELTRHLRATTRTDTTVK